METIIEKLGTKIRQAYELEKRLYQKESSLHDEINNIEDFGIPPTEENRQKILGLFRRTNALSEGQQRLGSYIARLETIEEIAMQKEYEATMTN